MTIRSQLFSIATGVITLGAISNADLPTQRFPIHGGSGGTAFSRDCGPGRVMTGIRGREGMLVDAVGLLCRPVSSTGELGPESTVGSLAGGGGGNTDAISCGAGQVVSGLSFRTGTYVDVITFKCKQWSPATRSYDGTQVGHGYLGRYPFSGGTLREYNCESNKQPASGIRGRASGVVDAIGLECDEP
jgi:hypothetical protein